MSWYDYVPVAGSIARLAQGDYKHAGADLFPIVGPAAYDTDLAFEAKGRGLDQAAQRTHELGKQMRDFQLQGLKQAENYYGPAMAATQFAYGPPGSMRK